jgi:F-type H+-transporting ATPase subunit O
MNSVRLKYSLQFYYYDDFLQPLDAAVRQELEATLKLFVKSGQSIKMKTHVDPSIMGGMVVSIGDKYVDMSTAAKIKRYSNLIQSPV